MISSELHLKLTHGSLVTVLPLASVERPGWLHRIHVAAGNGWVITEQIRTLSIQRFRRPASEISLSPDELTEVRRILARLLSL